MAARKNRTENKQQGIKEWIGKKIKDPAHRPFAVIMKSSDICNYLCSYCYVEHHSNVPIMPIETVEIAITKILEYVGPKRKVNFVWHGGEPLMAGLKFFEKVADICKTFTDNLIENSIQTNGSLLNRDLLEFCKDRGFSVSLSIDGPKKLHDLSRKNKKGNGTYDKTMATVELIRSIGLHPACVCVMHKQNVNHMDEVYSFFRKHKIHFRINPVVRSGRAISIYNSLAISPREYGKAMCRLFDLWFEDNGIIHVEPLHTILGNFISPTVWGCDYHGNCLESIIAINPDGNVYPCGRFAGLEQFKLGNIVNSKKLSSMFTAALFHRLTKRDTTTVKGCSKCEFIEVCNTGCMITAYMTHRNIYDRDYYCAGRKVLFAHIASKLKEHLNSIVVNN